MAAYMPAPYAADDDDSVICPVCARLNDEDAFYCDQCGTKLKPTAVYSADGDETVRCPICECMNDDDARYCDQCGNQLAGRTDIVTHGNLGKEPSAHSKPLPKDNLVRGLFHGSTPALELRAQAEGPPMLVGHFAVFNQWTEIDSDWEGNFMERIAPGAFTKTFAENRSSLRVLFQHGQDPDVGDKPIAAIRSLEEDTVGAAYEAQLFNGLPPLILDGLQHGAYGASFRFRVIRDDVNRKPERSDSNPTQMPERTIREVQCMEFGPVTFPAYEGATAGVRSLTDEYIVGRLVGDPERVRRLFARYAAPAPAQGAGIPHSPPASRTPVLVTQPRFHTREQWLEWTQSI